MNKFKEMLPHALTIILLALAGAYRSVGFAYASVLSLGLVLAYGAFSVLEGNKLHKSSIPDELRKQMQDLSARITSIEYEKQRRGF